MNPYNMSVAAMLRVLADYVEMCPDNVKLRIGVQFKLKNISLVNIPVMTADRFGATLAQWSSQQVIGVIKNFQKLNKTTEGQDLVDRFEQANRYMADLTK